MAEGCPLIVLRLVLIVTLTLSTTLAQVTFPWSTARTKQMTVCHDKECQERAKIIVGSMDKNADPCTDFYQYVCGKWNKKNPIPPDEWEWSIEKKLDIEAMEEMKNILKYGASIHDTQDVKDAKKLYHICNNLPTKSIMDANHLKQIIKRAGPWPMFNKEYKQKVSWIDIHNHYLQVTGDAGLYHIGSHYDHKTREIFIHLSHATPPFGIIQRLESWSNDENIKHPYFLLKLARTVMNEKHEPNESESIQDIADVLAFRQKLEKNFRMNSVEYSPVTLKYFHSWYDIKMSSQKVVTKIPWLQMFRDFFKNTGLTINEDTKIILQNRDSIANLPRILSHTPKHVIANHLHLYFIEKHILINENLNNALTNLLISNGKIVGNTASRLDKSISCIITHPMKDTLGELYIANHFSEKTRKSAMHYADKIKDMIKTSINSSTWLNSETMDMLVSKLNDVDLNMGYRNKPEPENMSPKDMKMTPYRAISFYTPKENGIFISAGYFRSPVYGNNLPSAVNYGTIGTFIAYEIYHALNVLHLHTDPMISKGVCKYCWPDTMLQTLEKKSKCFQDMYTDLVNKELEKIKPLPKTNGAQTLFENVADVMGIITGMETFKKILWESNGKCRILPHIKDLTCEKLFFISYAATYCHESPIWRLLKHTQMGTHSTSRLRVNVPLANMEEFKIAFQCSSDSPMVLKKTCNLW